MQNLASKKLAIFFFILLLMEETLVAQAPDKLYEKGMKALYDEDFITATDYFRQIEATGKSYKDSKYRLEICLLVQKPYRERPLTTILEFRELKLKGDKFYHYWMGRIFANRYMFPEAVASWKAFLERQGFKSDEIVNETQSFIEETQRLISYFDNPDDYEIHQLEAPVNTEYAELSPVYHLKSDELIFTSNRENPESDLFGVFETKSTDSGWESPHRISVINDLDRSQSAIEMVNRDGKLFVFDKGKKGSLYFSEQRNGEWSTPKEFDAAISASYLESNFYINEHEDRILFATADKKTGLQLMESFRNPNSGKWEDPHPVAGLVNSEYNEDSPYLSGDETKLYFASDRPGGLGGYDVYVSELDTATNQWSAPVNLGWPINSPDDDIQFKMNPDANSGYLASNRIHSKGDYDLFFFWGIEKTTIEGQVINAKTGEPIHSGEIRFHPSQYLDEYFRSPLDPSGKYKTEIISNESFLVKVIDEYDTLLAEFMQLHDPQAQTTRHYRDFFVYPADMTPEEIAAFRKAQEPAEKKEQPTALPQVTERKAEPRSEEKPREKTPFKISKKSQVLRNVYFQYGTSQLTEASEPKLTEVLNYLMEHPQKKIEISGHTDNVGAQSLNLALSQHRAEAAKTWLIRHGISADRIKAVGYGDTRPLASNDDEENGRELNRRIEIKEIE